MDNSFLHKICYHHFVAESTFSFSNGKWDEVKTHSENLLGISDFPDKQFFLTYCDRVAKLHDEIFVSEFLITNNEKLLQEIKANANNIVIDCLQARRDFSFHLGEIFYLFARSSSFRRHTRCKVSDIAFRQEFEYTIYCRILGLKCIAKTDAQRERWRRIREQIDAENAKELTNGRPPLKYLCAPIEEKVVFPERLPNVPSSELIVAIKFSDERYGYDYAAVIISDANKQNLRNGVLWVGHILSATILTKIRSSAHPSFQYNGAVYYVRDIQYGDLYDEDLNLLSEFCSVEAPQTIHVFAQKNLGKFSADDYECVTAMIPYSKRSIPVPVTVIHERTTHRYFISDAIYRILQGKYGLPYLRLRTVGRSSGMSGFSELREHSELFLLGYSVDMTKEMDDQDRRELLCNVIDSGIMAKPEVINHLEWLINTRIGMTNMEIALSKWRSDLEFISGYQMDKQRSIWVDSFASLYSGTIKLSP